MDAKSLEKIELEIAIDRERYLINCKKHYSEYVAAAQTLFPHYYKLIEDRTYDTPLVDESIRLKINGDVSGEIKVLQKAVDMKYDIPYVYERLAILYGKVKQYEAAQTVCKLWFDSIYWKIPNMSTTSLRLLKRLEKLNRRLEK